MAEDPDPSVRLPHVRLALLRDISTLATPSGDVDEVAFGDAVEEVWHLLDPSHGDEPGDVLLDDAEAALATRLWSALDRARWPLVAGQRSADPAWGEVAQLANALVDASSR